MAPSPPSRAKIDTYRSRAQTRLVPRNGRKNRYIGALPSACRPVPTYVSSRHYPPDLSVLICPQERWRRSGYSAAAKKKVGSQTSYDVPRSIPRGGPPLLLTLNARCCRLVAAYQRQGSSERHQCCPVPQWCFRLLILKCFDLICLLNSLNQSFYIYNDQGIEFYQLIQNFFQHTQKNH